MLTTKTQNKLKLTSKFPIAANATQKTFEFEFKLIVLLICVRDHFERSMVDFPSYETAEIWHFSFQILLFTDGREEIQKKYIISYLVECMA